MSRNQPAGDFDHDRNGASELLPQAKRRSTDRLRPVSAAWRSFGLRRAAVTEAFAGSSCERASEKGRLAFPSPVGLSGVADVRESSDETSATVRIEVHVANKVLGPLFGCRGSFTVAGRPWLAW